MTDVTVTAHGKLFTDPDPVLQRNGELIAAETARFGAQMIRDRLADVTVNATGHYRDSIVAVPVGEFVKISDSGVVYGPWLEGVGKRNDVSRFKGYSVFRKTADDIDAQVATRTAIQQERLARELEKV